MDKIETFCKNMARIMDERGIKQVALADKIGYTEQSVSGYVKTGKGYGNGKRPSLDAALAIAEALEVSLDELFEMPTHDDKTTPQTIGDVVRLIDTIRHCLSEDGAGAYVTIEEVAHEDYGWQIACLNIADGRIVDYCSKRDKMAQLVKDGTISIDIYNVWRQGQLAQLDTMEI